MSKQLIHDEQWFINTLKRITNQHAVGYESNLDFTNGMIRGWLVAKLITRKFANELRDNFTSNCFPEEIDRLKEKYGRFLG